MDLSGLSDQSLVDLHQVIADAVRAGPVAAGDNGRSAAREYAIWRTQAEAYETEMAARAIAFVAIDWE